MSPIAEFITASEASRRLGVSAKALRLYEERNLITPIRTEAGWRTYGPDEMSRAAQIVTLRDLGLSLGQVARVFDGDAQELDRVLATHLINLRKQTSQLADAMEQVRTMRTDLATGRAASAAELVELIDTRDKLHAGFDLPWPWGGERFELHDIQPLTFITGPLGSGKTRLAKRIAETLPGAAYLGLDRLAAGTQSLTSQLDASPDHQSRVKQAMIWLLDERASDPVGLHALVVELEVDTTAVLVVDMPEQGLDGATQNAIAAYLRCRTGNVRRLFVLTRSSAILDLALVGRDETIIYCPANHSPPMLVEDIEGTPGYESVATCLAPPNIRARTEGVIAMRRRIG